MHIRTSIFNTKYELYILSGNGKIHDLVSIKDKMGSVKLIYTRNKAKIINSENIDMYFEDNPVEAKLIQKQCPNCKVVLVDISWYDLNQFNGIIGGIKIKE